MKFTKGILGNNICECASSIYPEVPLIAKNIIGQLISPNKDINIFHFLL
jgi:hypothetical protein